LKQAPEATAAPGTKGEGRTKLSNGGNTMKPVRLISAGALLLLIGAITPLYAQEKDGQHEEDSKAPKQEQAKPEKQQEKQQAQPAKQEEQQQAKGQQEQQAKQQEQAKSNTQHEEQQAKSDQQAKGQQEKQQQEQAKSNTQHEEQQAKSAKQEQNQQAKVQQGQQHVQRTEAEQQRQRSQPALRLSARGEGRIPDDRFRSNFGTEHRFRIGAPVMVGGYSRFQYGGYWFGFVQPWPVGWFYTDDVYVNYIDGGYYLYNPYYPDTRVSINVVL
jgi:hypothetical protein